MKPSIAVTRANTHPGVSLRTLLLTLDHRYPLTKQNLSLVITLPKVSFKFIGGGNKNCPRKELPKRTCESEAGAPVHSTIKRLWFQPSLVLEDQNCVGRVLLAAKMKPRREVAMNMKRVIAFTFGCCLILCGLDPNAAAQRETVIAFTNGNWFNGSSFETRTGYSIGGVLTFRRPAQVDRTIDLKGGFVVPPFGEAHNHNVEPINKLDALIARYLQHGIFYVKNPNSLARDRQTVLTKINRPRSIDVIFSNGGLTGSGGHPVEIPERVIKRGLWTESDAEGGFYYIIDNKEQLDSKWPTILANKPEFIKTYLLYSEDYSKRRNDPHFMYWRGLDPSLLPIIVKRAHAAGLRVSTHIESAADFHNALVAGVDEINHMPGFRMGADVDQHSPSEFEISEADARLAARRGTFVVTTLLGAVQLTDPNQRKQQDLVNSTNLALLLRDRVKVALGSDSYRDDTVPEALYIYSLHIADNRTLLNLWCSITAGTIFPHRKIGYLKEGYEASFLVLASNPLDDFTAVEHITFRLKQGHVLDINSVDAVSNLKTVSTTGCQPVESVATNQR
jgi:hypothetical protein